LLGMARLLSLAGFFAVASAVHNSFGCVGDQFYDTGCLGVSPLGVAVGMIVYGAADTSEAAAVGAGLGEGSLACVLGTPPGGPLESSYSLFPGHLFAVRPFMACRDLDTVPWANNSAWGQAMAYSSSRGSGIMGATPPGMPAPILGLPGQLANESLGDACRRISQHQITWANTVNGSDFGAGVADTGMPFVAPCPRLGGYLGRGGTAQGYAAFSARDSAAQCAAVNAAYRTNECCSQSLTRPLTTPFSLANGPAPLQTCETIKRNYQGMSCCTSGR